MATPEPLLIDFDAYRAEQQQRPLIIRIGGTGVRPPLEPAGVGRARRDPAHAQRRDDRAARRGGHLGRGPVRQAGARRARGRPPAHGRGTPGADHPGHGPLRRRGQPTPKPGEPADAAPDPFDLIESWALVEADFMREYGIDLVTDLPRLTLRRFMVLVRGLGPASAVANRQAARHGRGGEPAGRVSRTRRHPGAVLGHRRLRRVRGRVPARDDLEQRRGRDPRDRPRHQPVRLAAVRRQPAAGLRDHRQRRARPGAADWRPPGRRRHREGQVLRDGRGRRGVRHRPLGRPLRRGGAPGPGRHAARGAP